MRSYLFKSKPEDVINFDSSQKVNKTFSGIESSGIDPTTLTVLESILTGEDYYNIYEKGEYEIIKKVEEDDTSYLFVSSSTNLIDCLKRLSIEQKKEILKKWCSTQEMTLYGWTPERAERIIDWLISTSRHKGDPEEKIMLLMQTGEDVIAL